MGDTVYFLSDRNGPVSLFAYDTKSKQVTEAVKNTDLDFKTASAGPDAIVYEQFGALRVYDLKTRKTLDVAVQLSGDLPEIRPHFRKITPNEIRGAGISPTGARALFVAHGEVFTVPTEKGDIRNLTNSPAAADRDAAWSADGKYRRNHDSGCCRRLSSCAGATAAHDNSDRRHNKPGGVSGGHL